MRKTKEEGQRLIFTDNGQGLIEEEIHQFLAIIGESSKRNWENGRIESDYIGRFGIGLHNNEMSLLNRNILTLMERGLSDV